MIFLGPVYRNLYAHYAAHINHFPLIRLVMLSLDKTILYLLLFLCARGLYLLLRRRRVNFWRELLLFIFVAYVLLVWFLTVFRGTYYYPWQLVWHLHRSLTVINWQPLVETLKLTQGATMFDFYYQSFGNIAWFVPFGLLAPGLMRRKRRMLRTIVFGSLMSLAIETMQFFLITGITDIDDWIFNTIGVVLGYLVFAILAAFWRLIRRGSKQTK
ncbi:VanZ family protein [Lacticaseibacillus zhaodongensis]|uniref:VanZ family protein n=1 Tax=Lacticaseibacillus zhaodongensis TaxID=2668065 RepID=UPI0012D33465|nr:VanZ family protein [Lacticaseibacillus zhaodongensis]